MNKKKIIITSSAWILLFSLISIYVYAACSSSPAYTKGDCEFGQVCAGEECEWADRDFDGYPNYDYCIKFPDGTYNCDCDDYDPAVHPGATELCNYKDDDCDGIEVTTDMDTCSEHSIWAYPYGYVTYIADCGIKDAIYAGHGCEAGDGTYTDYGNYIEFSCPPADGNQDNSWAWQCCSYNVTETGGEIDEGDVCEKTLYICDEESFFTTHQGGGVDISTGYCDGKTWCLDTEDVTRDEGECEYTAEEDHMGVNEFDAYFCDKYDCYKFVGGTFQVCGYGWECTAICFPGECNYETKEFCDIDGIWKTDGWCHTECGRADSLCGGNCEEDVCDLHAGKVCNENGYWVEDNYCDCDVCGSIDSSCLSGCACEEDFCDTANEYYCDDSIWSQSGYCLFEEGKCCEEDYNCQGIYLCGCEEGACDTTNNRYCSGDEWIYGDDLTTYCQSDICGEKDFDCGSEPCEDGKCDIINNFYCDNGVWDEGIDYPDPYCYPGYCGTQDSECECTNEEDDCCLGEDDGVCDPNCLLYSDDDCEDLYSEGCTENAGDCCDDTSGNGCDPDCIPKVDPDCQTTCDTDADACCSGLDDEDCDPDCTENSDSDCEEVCTTARGDCCIPNVDGICDPDCIPKSDPDCAAYPCEEEWVCNEWDEDCDGVHDTHTCLEWEDKNGCNTFFDKPTDSQDCYKEFACEPEDDTDEDGYPGRACYSEELEEVLGDPDWDCNDNNADIYPGAEEVCNGADDNCDGSTDEGCPCTGGDTQYCGKNEGICRQGIQTCVDGYWSVCGGSGYVGPKKEECDDGLDNNCDGYIDENCNCIEGEERDCGTDAGICEKGWQACYEGTFGSVCNDQVEGTEEVCDNSLDDDCDSYTDGDDSSCQVETPVTEAPASCQNRKQDSDEEGVDCGGICPDSCEDKSPACDYGQIEEKCICGKAAYRTGYCCNGKYSIAACIDAPEDSDNDGCNDDQELQMGTDVYSEDTDFDGLLDCDALEALPLCNEDGVCDAEREYPETLENCPADCEKIGIGWLTWLILIVIILALGGIGGYLYVKSKGYKLSDLIKLKGKKKEAQKFPFFQRGIQKKPLPAKQPAKPVAKPAARPMITAKPRKMDMLHLNSFVRNSLKKGYTKLQIRQSAIKAGWTNEQITKALKGKKSKYKLI